MTYDSWDRYTCEGYGWMPLAAHCPGSGTHYVSTWQPLGAPCWRLWPRLVAAGKALLSTLSTAKPVLLSSACILESVVLSAAWTRPQGIYINVICCHQPVTSLV
jgi:hypothetical protein